MGTVLQFKRRNSAWARPPDPDPWKELDDDRFDPVSAANADPDVTALEREED